MHGLLFGTTAVAAFLGGMVALFAPCCISVMLPAYLATSLRRRRQLVAMTFVFAAGVSTVILPISFGATALSRLINGQHTLVYSVMAAVMVAMGAAMVLGFKVPIPMFGMSASNGTGAGRAFILGAFSGVATACCAPVLAGVVALSGAAGSFLTALVIGVAYVFGMVAPLFAMAFVWDRRLGGGARQVGARNVALRLFGYRRVVPFSYVAGGLLLVVMGILVGILAATGPNMATNGWQASLASDLQHYAHIATTWFGHVPGFVTALVLFGLVALLARLAIPQVAAGSAGTESPEETPETVDSDLSCPDAGTKSAEQRGAHDPEASTHSEPVPAMQKG